MAPGHHVSNPRLLARADFHSPSQSSSDRFPADRVACDSDQLIRNKLELLEHQLEQEALDDEQVAAMLRNLIQANHR